MCGPPEPKRPPGDFRREASEAIEQFANCLDQINSPTKPEFQGAELPDQSIDYARGIWNLPEYCGRPDCSISLRGLNRLVELGISLQTVMECSLFWRAQVKFTDGLFAEHTEDSFAFIMPIVEGGAIIDWIAFTEREFGTLHGFAFCLGGDHLAEAQLWSGSDWQDGEKSRVVVFCHPLDWLKANCQGLVVLTSEFARLMLDGVDLISADFDLCCQLREATQPLPSTTEILFDKNGQADG